MSVSFSLYFEINSGNISNVCSTITTTPSDITPVEDSNGDSYIPNEYNLQPNMNNGYTPPSGSNLSYAYYNVSPFIAKIYPGPKPSQYSSNNNLFGTYIVSYNIENISQINQYQLYDIIYLYYYLSLTFSKDFLASNYYNNASIPSLTKTIINYCNITGNMNSGLCSSISGLGSSLPVQTLLTQSPCTNPYSTCYDGWDNYCFQSGNYDSPECLNYYSGSYNNNQLNSNIKNGLLNICSSIYNSNTTPPENFWEVCSCFLPQEVYTEFLEKNNVTGISQGSQQCWYFPCISASIKPQSSANCPNSTVVNCIQKQYLTLQNTGGDITDNIINTEQAISNCSASNTSSGSSPTPSGSSPTTSGSSPTPVPVSNNTSIASNVPSTSRVMGSNTLEKKDDKKNSSSKRPISIWFYILIGFICFILLFTTLFLFLSYKYKIK